MDAQTIIAIGTAAAAIIGAITGAVVRIKRGSNATIARQDKLIARQRGQIESLLGYVYRLRSGLAARGIDPPPTPRKLRVLTGECPDPDDDSDEEDS